MKDKEKKDKKKSSFFKKILIVVLTIIVIISGLSLAWMSKSYKPQEVAKESLKSSKNITVEDGKNIIFTPKNINKKKGFIFYPGGGVDPEAYAPLCRSISEQGYKVIIAKMPLNLAVLSPNKASNIIEENKDIETWIIGGHSLGGVMASKYASQNNQIKGVVLYASYPSGNELKNKEIKVLSIFGSDDGVINKEKLKESKNNLPDNTKFIEINKGNHSQFGDYGLQKGDNKVSIDNKKQTSIAADYTTKLLNKIN